MLCVCFFGWFCVCMCAQGSTGLVLVCDNLWRKAPLEPGAPSVCSTKRDPISLKKHGIPVLLRFLQIWSCGKICHNYPGGVTPICLPGHSVPHRHLICSQTYLVQIFLERPKYFHWCNQTFEETNSESLSRCSKGCKKRDLIVLRWQFTRWWQWQWQWQCSKTLSAGKLPLKCLSLDGPGPKSLSAL